MISPIFFQKIDIYIYISKLILKLLSGKNVFQVLISLKTF